MTLKDSPKMKRAYTKHTCTLGCNKPRCIKNQRDQLIEDLKAARNQSEIRGQIIEALQGDITHLQHKLAEQTNTSRHWVLRKLGL